MKGSLMEKEKIMRINALAKKAKEAELTLAEQAERQQIRDEYLADFRNNLSQTLNTVYVVDENGNPQKLQKKGQHREEHCCNRTHHHHHDEHCQCGHHHKDEK